MCQPLLAGQFAQQAAALDDGANFQAAVAGGAGAVEDLTAALKGPRPDLAALALGKIKLPAASPALAAMTGDADGEVRSTVAWALGQCGGAEATGALVKLADDSYAPARAAALLALGQLKAPEGDEALRKALSDKNESIRRAAAEAIGDSGRAELAISLAELLTYRIERVEAAEADAPGDGSGLVDKAVWSEPSAAIRLTAISALGALKSPDALPPLIVALEREESFNRLAIIEAIGAQGPAAASACLGRIVPLPYDKETFARNWPTLICNGTLAVIAGKAGDDRCVEYLLDTLKLPRAGLGEDKDLTELTIQSVELLGEFAAAHRKTLADANGSAEAKAAATVGLGKVEKAARPLAALLKDPRVQQLADATEKSIRQIGQPAARPLAANMDNWQMAPVFLRLLREEDLRTAAARETMIKYLSHESDAVRLEATETLGLYLFEGVLDEYDLAVLESMYLDANTDVRAACERWKQKIQMKSGETK